ncbi:MAG TPA: hypothetical protein VLK84_03820, partial [Longimicrobium sp.]|nr:hypothetical protein [Longimicrobium sp.]
AFLETVSPGISIRREVVLAGYRSLRADLIIGSDNLSVIIEVKRTGYLASAVRNGHNQVLRYLEATGFEHGILFIPMSSSSTHVSTTEYDVGGKHLFVHTVGPFPVSDDPNDF